MICQSSLVVYSWGKIMAHPERFVSEQSTITLVREIQAGDCLVAPEPLSENRLATDRLRPGKRSRLGRIMLLACLPWLVSGNTPVGCGELVGKETSMNILEEDLVVSTYNIKSGERGLNEVAKALASQQSDVTCLQESRGTVLGELARKSSMEYAVSSWSPVSQLEQAEGYGNAILTKLPVTRREVYPLYSGDLQRRNLLVATIHRGNDKLVVATTHLTNKEPGLFGSSRDGIRRRQAEEILTILSTYQDSEIIFCGDLNTSPVSDVIEEFRHMFTDVSKELGDSPVTFPFNQKTLDYIMFRGDWKPVGLRTFGGDASDHCGVTTVLRKQ